MLTATYTCDHCRVPISDSLDVIRLLRRYSNYHYCSEHCVKNHLRPNNPTFNDSGQGAPLDTENRPRPLSEGE